MPSSLPIVGTPDVWSTALTYGLLALGTPIVRCTLVGAALGSLLSWLTRTRSSRQPA